MRCGIPARPGEWRDTYGVLYTHTCAVYAQSPQRGPSFIFSSFRSRLGSTLSRSSELDGIFRSWILRPLRAGVAGLAAYVGWGLFSAGTGSFGVVDHSIV